jgi:hypothetical protein
MDGGLPQLVVSAKADAPWLDVVRSLDQCRAGFAARRYVLEVSSTPPRATRELTVPLASATSGMAPPRPGETPRPGAPIWLSVELTREGQLFVGGQRIDSDAALDAALRSAGGPVHAVVNANEAVPAASVIELLTRLQARGLDPGIAVSR